MPSHSSNPPKGQPSGEAKTVPTYGVGEAIAQSGIYRVEHAGHRVNHFVVLLAGEAFPRCARCADQVRFTLFQATTDTRSDPDFRVRLYEIPHPPPVEGEEEENDEVA